MSTLAERLKEALAQSGVKQIEIASLCKIAPASVSDWFTGKTKSIRSTHLEKVANLLNVSSVWLSTGQGEMKSQTVLAEDKVNNSDEWIEIPEYRIKFAAGFDQEPNLEELDSNHKAVYRRSWFIDKRINPNDCKRFRVAGDSMEPLLLDGDVVLVNCAEKFIIDGRVYAFVFGNALRVKRLYSQIDRSILVCSENPNFADEKIPPDEVDQVKIIGEVIERSGSI